MTRFLLPAAAPRIVPRTYRLGHAARRDDQQRARRVPGAPRRDGVGPARYPQDDRLLTAAAAAKIYGDAYAGLPSAKLVPITSSYHFIMQDQAVRFAAELEAFLKR